MNNELIITKKDGQLVTDSREISVMINREHNHLLRDIRKYIAAIDENPHLDSRNFFIENSYLNIQNKEQPCYLVTKKGCDMIANKMIGTKGIQFTAMYVSRFEQMQNQLTNTNTLLIANNVIVLRDTKSFSKRNIRKTFESIPVNSISTVYKEFKDYIKGISDIHLKYSIISSAYKGIRNNISNNMLNDYAINNEWALHIQLELLQIINRLNKKILNENKKYINYIDPPIKYYNIINVHPFTCNKVDDYAYTYWKTNFPIDEIIIDNNLDFNKKVNIWLKFDHLDKFDVTNFSKTFIDKLASVFKVDDKFIQLKECSTNKIVDNYSEGKIYYIISQD